MCGRIDEGCHHVRELAGHAGEAHVSAFLSAAARDALNARATLVASRLSGTALRAGLGGTLIRDPYGRAGAEVSIHAFPPCHS